MLIRCPFHPHVTAVTHKRPWSNCLIYLLATRQLSLCPSLSLSLSLCVKDGNLYPTWRTPERITLHWVYPSTQYAYSTHIKSEMVRAVSHTHTHTHTHTRAHAGTCVCTPTYILGCEHQATSCSVSGSCSGNTYTCIPQFKFLFSLWFVR